MRSPMPDSDRTAPADRGTAQVVAVQESLVTVEVTGRPIMKNEVGYVCLGEQRLKAEVIRVHGRTAEMQVFEDTRGVRIGERVELSGEMLSAVLAPGLLGQVFDGLENPLAVLAREHGFFLPRGVSVEPVDTSRIWHFTPSVASGARLEAGEVLGTVQEGPFVHRIMVPFGEQEPLQVQWIRRGDFDVSTPIALLRTAEGQERELSMTQRWPVRRPLPEGLLRRRLAERLYPTEPLTTTVRIVDTFFPIARGGTACIPGPFGAGKTVLQSLIARYAAVDIVIIVACGERAGEVVETITEFPNTEDPRTGGSLMDRTIIICNTSSMPVAARESSIYMGVTLGEYYRQMGYNVLVIADSTSRWAQAMRETSGRMEEIPGEDAYPAYLDSAIKSIYERAGVIRTSGGTGSDRVGSVTLIGTVSPAGGNFEEPVTQATLGTVKTFLGLSAERAYRRAYPAIDPLLSWSRYLTQLQPWFAEHIGPQWTADVQRMRELLQRGETVYQMMQVTGEEGITLEDYVIWQKAALLDTVFLQQDAFDPVDVSMPRERQVESFRFLLGLVDRDYRFEEREQARDVFTRLAGLYRNWNYSPRDSVQYTRYREELEALADQHVQGAPATAPHAAPADPSAAGEPVGSDT